MSETEKEPLLAVSDLQVHFENGFAVSRAVDGVSFHVHRNETVCIVGESGCGKTVTALSVLGLIPCPPGRIAGGSIRFEGKDLLEATEQELQHIRGNDISMVFQEPLTSLNPVFTVGDQIGEAIRTHQDMSEEDIRSKCIQLLDDVGIPEPERRLDDYPHQLSGGQRQRVMIAMALSCDPKLVIADEPTTALDVTVQAQIIGLLKEIQSRREMAVLEITHDLGVVANVADRVYVMYAGIVVETGITEEIFDSPQHPYTRALLDSLPSRDKRGKRLYTIPGSVPNPSNKPPGCPFHPRCRVAVSSCSEQVPEMCQYSDTHHARCPVVFQASKERS